MFVDYTAVVDNTVHIAVVRFARIVRIVRSSTDFDKRGQLVDIQRWAAFHPWREASRSEKSISKRGEGRRSVGVEETRSISMLKLEQLQQPQPQTEPKPHQQQQ